MIGERIWPTVLLLGHCRRCSSTVIGLWLGARAGWRRGSRFDQVSLRASLALYSMPECWLGLMLLIAFAVGVGSFPGHLPDRRDVDPARPWPAWAGWDVPGTWCCPCLTLALVYIAEYSLIMRSSLLDELGADYLTTARAKGLRDALVLRRHAVPNALLPSMTLFFLSLGFVVSGAITVETVFSWPGLGRLTYDALRGPDYPAAAGAVPGLLRGSDHHEPGRRPALRLPRPAGADRLMTQPTIEEPLGGRPWPTRPAAGLPPQLSPRAIARARRRQAPVRAWRSTGATASGMFGLAILVLFVAMAVFAPLLARASELDVTKATGAPFSPPQRRVPARDRRDRPLGADPDHLGRRGCRCWSGCRHGDLDGDRHAGRHRGRPLRRLDRLRC